MGGPKREFEGVLLLVALGISMIRLAPLPSLEDDLSTYKFHVSCGVLMGPVLALSEKVSQVDTVP